MRADGSTLADWLVEARRRLLEAGIADAALDARLLVAGLLGLSATEMLTDERRPVSQQDGQRITEALARRVAREPVHRILGEREFYGLRLSLSPGTLEPRPDTETLVEVMIPHLQSLAKEVGPLHILDIGTGTGAICLALLSALPEAHGTASDVSEDALKTARGNAVSNGLMARFDTIRADWFSGIQGRFHAIVSNPPYIPSRSIGDLEPEVRDFDPHAALDGGPDGLSAYRAIAVGAASFVHPRGFIGLEIGYDQKHEVSRIFRDKGFRLCEAAKDYGGRDRVVVFVPE